MSRGRGGGKPPPGGTPGDSGGGTPPQGGGGKAPNGRPQKRSATARRPSTGQTPPRARERPEPRWAQPFLQMLAATRDVTKAALTVGVSRAQVYDRRGKHDDFARAWDEIMTRRLRDDVRASLFQLGVVGFVEETTIHRDLPARGNQPPSQEVETRKVTRIYPNVTELLAKTHLPEVRAAVGREGVGADPGETAARIREFLALADATVPPAPEGGSAGGS